MTEVEKLNKISELVNSLLVTVCDKSCDSCCEKVILTQIKKILLEN